jgi:hypothetical protein
LSSTDFQIALAKLIASPQLCEKALADQDSFFADFVLTEKEKRRLHSVLRQKGISACCSLYRMNRVTPVYTQLSNTCTLLGDELLPVIEGFWEYFSGTSLQFKEEVLEFGSFLMNKIDNGMVKIPFLKEVLQLEIAMNELSYLPEGETRVLQFEHDIFQLLHSLAGGTLDSDVIEKSQAVHKMYLKNMEIRMDVI